MIFTFISSPQFFLLNILYFCPNSVSYLSLNVFVKIFCFYPIFPFSFISVISSKTKQKLPLLSVLSVLYHSYILFLSLSSVSSWYCYSFSVFLFFSWVCFFTYFDCSLITQTSFFSTLTRVPYEHVHNQSQSGNLVQIVLFSCSVYCL